MATSSPWVNEWSFHHPAETVSWWTFMEAMPAATRQWTWPERVFTGPAWKQTSLTTSSSASHASKAATYQLRHCTPNEIPPGPWVKIGVDFFQDHLGKKHLIVADYFSKFPYVFPVASTHHSRPLATYGNSLQLKAYQPSLCLTTDLPSTETSLGNVPMTLTSFIPHRHPLSSVEWFHQINGKEGQKCLQEDGRIPQCSG